jgi:hypothetical protein
MRPRRWHKRGYLFSNTMPPTSTEDTMIVTQPVPQMDLLPTSDDDSSEPSGVLERCRATFRLLGERMSSFDFSRQIYG